MLDLLQGLKKGVVMYSIITIIMGIILILFPDTTSLIVCYGIAGVILIIPFVIGMFIVVEGILNIVRSFQLRQWGFERWLYDLVLSVLLLILGMIIVVNPFDAALVSVMMIGICLVYDGLLNLLILHRSSQFVKQIRD